MNIQTELKLVEEAQSDVQAFDKLYECYFGKILAYTLNRVGKRETAEDIVSDVFLAAVETIFEFDTSRGVRFGSWLYQVAHNKIVDHHKRNKKQVRVALRLETLKSEDLADEYVLLSEKQRQIAFVLTKLKPRYQQMISLRFFSELSNAEIAEIMDMKSTQVAVLLHRSLNSFKKKFKKNFKKSEIF